MKQVSLPHAPGATVYWTTYSYDALGRTVTATKADGSVTSYLYQGNCTTITDPTGKWKSYTSDAMGNLTLVSEPAPGGGTYQTTYTYNLLNKLTGVSMPRGSVTQTRTFNYDLTTGRLMSATNPETGTVSYSYRADGSLASKTDAKSQQTTYSYDGYGRLTSAAGYTYYYDSNPLDSTYPSNYGWGRLTAVAWTSTSMGMDFSEMYSYSQGGLMVGKRVLVSPNPDPTGGKGAVPQNLDSVFTYDNEGHYLGPQSYPEWPQTFGYSQDTLGRPTGIWANPMNPGDNARMVVQDVIYGVAGELQQARIFKEPPMYTYVQSYLRQNWTYNTLFQATRETSVDEEGWISTTVVDLQYSYTAGQNNGRITQRTEAVSGEQVSYSYDSLNRLIAAVTTGPQYGLTWTYDGFGNMTAQQVTKGSGYNNNLSYNGLTNRITTPGYGYDANGNLTAMPALTMQYDAQNRMVSSTPAGGGTTTVYAYGPGGQRVGQSYAPDPNNWQNNMWSIYVYGPDGRRIGDCRAGYAPQNPQYPGVNMVFGTSCWTAYVHFRGRLVRMESPPALQDGVWVDQRGTTTGTDRLGSVHYWENTATTNYYPYGEEETATWNDKQKFATYTRDSATGLDYAQNRYYASQIGRFTTADPYRASAKRANPQSWNRYAYVQNDPVNANDPSGLDCDFVGADGQTIGDPGSGCGGPSIGWGDEDPGASVNSCTQAAMFGIDGCGRSGTGTGGSNSGSAACYGNSLFSTIPWCDSSGNPAPWQPAPTPDCPPQYQNWIDAYGFDAAMVAGQIGTSEADILALSAYESGWGGSRFAGAGAFFNLETVKPKKGPNPPPLMYSTGWMQATQPNKNGRFALVATYSSYYDSAESFAYYKGSLFRPIRHCSGRRSIMGGCRIANCTPRFLGFGRRGRWNG